MLMHPYRYALIVLVLLVMIRIPAFTQGLPPTEIFLSPVALIEGKITLGPAENITMREGYDNQPSFLPDGGGILFTSIREDNQADTYLYTFGDRSLTRKTTTPESEYSPMVTPKGDAFSVVRVEKDSTQRLWQFPLNSGEPSLVLKTIKPVGYYVWVDSMALGAFILGDSTNTLQVIYTGSEVADTISADIGRALHVIPGQKGMISFIHKVSEKEWWAKALDIKTRTVSPLVKTQPGSEDLCWLADGSLLSGSGGKLFLWNPETGPSWQEIADFSDQGISDITRIAVSAQGDKIAFVAKLTAAAK